MKCHCFHLFPFYLPWSDETRCHDLSLFLILSFKLFFFHSPPSPLSKRFFSSSSLSAIRMVSSAYLWFWYFSQQSWFQLATHQAWNFTWYALCISLKNRWQVLSYSFLNPEPVMQGSNCCFLNIIQVSQETGRWSDIPIYLRVFYSLLWCTQSRL